VRRGKHHIDVNIERPFAGSISARLLATAAQKALEIEGLSAVEMSIVVSDDETVQRLNRDYAGQDEVTDVLSFSLREGEAFVSPSDEVLRLGEVIIAYPTAQRQAAQAGRSSQKEVAHLLIHGILHLLGYDHIEQEDEQRMRAKEEALLATLTD